MASNSATNILGAISRFRACVVLASALKLPLTAGTGMHAHSRYRHILQQCASSRQTPSSVTHTAHKSFSMDMQHNIALDN